VQTVDHVTKVVIIILGLNLQNNQSTPHNNTQLSLLTENALTFHDITLGVPYHTLTIITPS